MSKFFMYGTELQELEQIMMLVPNFLPRRSGVIIQKKLQNKNEGLICYETIVENCYREFKSCHFKRRLGRLVRNFDGEVFINLNHRFRFYKVCRIQNVSLVNRNPGYLAVLFLLTSSSYWWFSTGQLASIFRYCPKTSRLPTSDLYIFSIISRLTF